MLKRTATETPRARAAITIVLVGPIVGVCILVLGRQDRLLADSEHVQMA